MCVRHVAEYLMCIEKIPVLAALMIDKMRKLLSHFNTRCAMLILGAQATMGPHKTCQRITAKHLSLCSRSLAMVQCLIPHIVSYLRRNVQQQSHVLSRQSSSSPLRLRAPSSSSSSQAAQTSRT